MLSSKLNNKILPVCQVSFVALRYDGEHLVAICIVLAHLAFRFEFPHETMLRVQRRRRLLNASFLTIALLVLIIQPALMRVDMFLKVVQLALKFSIGILQHVDRFSDAVDLISGS